MKTKEKILNAARTLFNLNGVENVTTRNIAASIGISQGNLHYHYPNKDEIVVFLFQEFKEKAKNLEKFTGDNNLGAHQIIQSTKVNFELMQEYRFLFVDDHVLWRRNPSLKLDMITFFNTKKLDIKN